MVTGIICEYNPLHLGHKKQLDAICAADPDGIIVCLMSGNYVQRGKPSIVDKSLRAKAAVMSGADLVLELPITAALSSAEGFAAEGVRILNHFCTHLCFGAETADADTLMQTASALLSEDFPIRLREQLDKGLSFPAARAAALENMGIAAVTKPNDILAVEYCKAILSQKSTLLPMPIQRQGDYHDTAPDMENPSATAIRNLILEGSNWLDYIPVETRGLFSNAPIYTLTAGERAVLARLRCMTDAEFETLPYGSEGLWRKFMHACRSCDSVEAIIAETKSKRYTRTRIDRMLMCAYLGITKEMLEQDVPYTRVLALNGKGRIALKHARLHGAFPHTGEAMDDPYWALEQRAADLYSLFCTDSPGPAGQEEKQRVFFKE